MNVIETRNFNWSNILYNSSWKLGTYINHQSKSQFLHNSPLSPSYLVQSIRQVPPIVTIPPKLLFFSSLDFERCGGVCEKREETGRVAARWAVGAVVRAARGQHQRKETVRTYSGWFGSTSRGAEQRSRSTRVVCAAAVTRGILSRVSALADVVARECVVENRSLRSSWETVRKGITLGRGRRKGTKVRVLDRCSEKGFTKNDSTFLAISSFRATRVQESTSLSKSSFQNDVSLEVETDIPRSLCCVRVSTSFSEHSEDVSSLSEVKSVAKVEGKSS